VKYWLAMLYYRSRSRQKTATTLSRLDTAVNSAMNKDSAMKMFKGYSADTDLLRIWKGELQ